MLKSQTKGETPDGIGETPVLVIINGTPFWQASGRTFPVVAGAEDPPPGDGKDGDPKPPASGDPKGGSGDSGGDDFDKPRALATINKLRENEKALKAQLKELDDLKAKQQERDDAEKSESEKLREQLADIQAKQTAAERALKETQTRQAIERSAVKAGAADPEDVFALLKSAEFDFDDEGGLKNADKLVGDLLKAKPYLVTQQNTARGNSAGPRPAGQPGADDQVKQAEAQMRASGKYPPF